MKMLCRLFLLLGAASVLAPAAHAHTDSASTPAAVTGLRAFQLRADEAAGHEFARTVVRVGAGEGA